jgi:hypothetical protein
MYAATTGVGRAAAVGSGAGVVVCAPAQDDVVAYLVDVTVRPGYNCPYADAVLRYEYGICEKAHTIQSSTRPVAQTTYESIRAAVGGAWHTNDVLGDRALKGDSGSDGSTPKGVHRC